MNVELISRLRCPASGQVLDWEPNASGMIAGGSKDSGWLVSADGLHRYPVHRGIPRFVPASNYADNFGMQWNKFRQTQLDSHSGHSISADRFWKATGWRPEDIKLQQGQSA